MGSNNSWFYKQSFESTQEEGPVSEELLQGLIRSQALPIDTLVRSDNLSGWTPASMVPGFNGMPPGLAPASKPAATLVASPPTDRLKKPEEDAEYVRELRDLIKDNVDLSATARDTAAKDAGVDHRSVSINPEIFFNCYFKNAYRVLGLSSTSSPSDIKRTLSTIRKQAKIGKTYVSPFDTKWLAAISRTERDFMEAETRLLNPVSRLQQRMLWFHTPVESFPQIADASAAAAIAEQWHQQKDDPSLLHDAALMMQLAAIADSPDCRRQQYWMKAIAFWQELLKNEAYWTYLSSLDQSLGFEPAYQQSDMLNEKENFLSLVSEPLLLLAKDALHDQVAESFAYFGSLVIYIRDQRINDQLFDELHVRMDGKCRDIDKLMADKIDRDIDTYQSHLAENAAVCQECEQIYHKDIAPILVLAGCVLQNSDPVLNQLQESAVNCLASISAGYSWADDTDSSTRLINLAKPLAATTSLEPKLMDDLEAIERVKDNKVAAELLKDAKPIKITPWLFTLNGVGGMLYPAIGDKPDPILGTKRGIYYFVLLFIPIFPISAYRVVFLPDGTYKYYGRIPMDRLGRIHQGILALWFLWVFFIGPQFSPPTVEPDPQTQSANSAGAPANNEAAYAVVELNNEGVKALEAGNFPVAIEKFQGAVSINPNYTLGLENLGIAYNNLGLKAPRDKQIECFEKATYVTPNNPVSRGNLDACIKASGMDPKSFKDRIKLAKKALKEGHPGCAIVEYEAALAIKDDKAVRKELASIECPVPRSYDAKVKSSGSQ